MINFENYYDQTEFVSSFSLAGVLSSEVSAPAGVYNAGLISILDEELGRKVLNDWQWYLEDAVALAATWQGNFFIWSPKRSAVFYFDTQRRKATFVDKSIDRFINEFLTKSEVRKEVLMEAFFEEIRIGLGGLNYCECFIAKPWQMLGGSGKVETYGTGDLEVYSSLTGQTIRQVG